jgi:hypothetical protein
MLVRAGVASLLPLLAWGILPSSPCGEGEGSLYDHSLPLLDQSRNISLAEYEGKVVLLVNVASY